LESEKEKESFPQSTAPKNDEDEEVSMLSHGKV
jgi:hypothetical protein